MRALGYGICCVLGLLLSASSVHALGVNPARQTIVVKAGETTRVTITATNDENETIVISPEVQTFGIDSKTGQTILHDKSEKQSWVRSNTNQKTLKPEEQAVISFDITAPPSAETGAHYLALFIKKQGDQGQVGVGTRVGSLLFLYVEGDVRQQLQAQTIVPKQPWFMQPPLAVTLKYTNSGNIHTIPTGNIQLTKEDGTVIKTQSINEEQTKILAGETWERTLTFSDFSIKDAGKIIIKSTATYGTQQKTVSDITAIWYIPKSLIILSGLLLLSIAIGLIFLISRHAKK